MTTDTANRTARLLEIGIALSAELNLDALLEKALTYARDLTSADAGTLYLVEEDTLSFRILQNASLDVHQGGPGRQPVELEPVPLEKTNVSAYAALLGETVRINDVYDNTQFDFSGPRRYDEKTGYRSRSMLVVPMRNHEGDVIGVLQLINRTVNGKVCGFPDESVEIARSLASQAAVAITNAALVQETRDLFESLIKVLATAIDQKSPYTGNHVQRVAQLNVLLAEAINEQTEGPFADVHFSAKELEEIRLAGWLHDVGKVTTPVWVMDKATKLESIHDRIELVKARFALIARDLELQALREQNRLLREGAEAAELDNMESEMRDKRVEMEGDLVFLCECNEPGEFLSDDKIERLHAIAAKRHEMDGQSVALVTTEELAHLSVRRGTLTDEEMRLMREHVVLTARMLQQVPFGRHLARVPVFASQHHERLDGRGYPGHLAADEVPLQSRILAVADFYEALSAKDRPYKKPMSEEQILSILTRAAEADEIDRDVLELLAKNKIHQRFEMQYTEKMKHKNPTTPGDPS